MKERYYWYWLNVLMFIALIWYFWPELKYIFTH